MIGIGMNGYPMNNHIPTFQFSAKEVLILIHALRLSFETGEILEYARKAEVMALNKKLNEGGVK